MCRVSLVASTMLLLHGLRCSCATSPMWSREEAKISRKSIRVPHGATILPRLSTSICDNLLSKNNLKNSGHDMVAHRILCVWFCGPRKYRFFGSQSCSIRDGLRYFVGSCIRYFVSRADFDLFVRFENTASCMNARRHDGSRVLCLLACVVALRSARTWFAALCRADCAVLCCAVLAVDARRQHSRIHEKGPQKQKIGKRKLFP